MKDLGRRIGDFNELPEELRSQLQAAKTGDLEDDIISIIKDEYNGYANIDEILVSYYKKKQEVLQRQFLSNKLYRMSKSGLIYSIKGKKGAYATNKDLINAQAKKKPFTLR